MKALPCAKSSWLLSIVTMPDAVTSHLRSQVQTPKQHGTEFSTCNEPETSMQIAMGGLTLYVLHGNGQTKTAIEQVFSTFGCIGGPYNEGAFYRIIPFYDGDGVRRWTPAGHQLELYFAHC